MRGKNVTKISHVGIRVGHQYVERFTYPLSPKDKMWAKSAGIQVAACCKAILGKTPFRWPELHRSSAEFIAKQIPEAQVVKLKAPRVKA